MGSATYIKHPIALFSKKCLHARCQVTNNITCRSQLGLKTRWLTRRSEKVSLNLLGVGHQDRPTTSPNLTKGFSNHRALSYRSVPVGNDPTPQRRISKRMHNNDRWINKPACSKRRHAVLETASNVVSHTRERVRGFRLVKVGRGTPKRIRLVSSGTFLNAGNNTSTRGLLSALRSDLSNTFLNNTDSASYSFLSIPFPKPQVQVL